MPVDANVVKATTSSSGFFRRARTPLLLLVSHARRIRQRMEQQELLNKLAQIEEHARSALSDFPSLGKERLRMIVALARFITSEIEHASLTGTNERPASDTSANDARGSRST